MRNFTKRKVNMGTRLSSLAKDTAIYGLSSIVGRFLNYLLVPLYTNVIKAQTGGYAAVTKVYAWTAFLLVILIFGMETTLLRFGNKESEDRNKVFSTALIGVGLFSLIFVILCQIFTAPISSLLGYPTHPDYVRVMSVVVALDAFQAVMFTWLRMENRAIKFVILKFYFILMNVCLNLFFILLVPKIYTPGEGLFGWFSMENLVSYIFYVNLFCTATATLGFIPEIRYLRFGFDKALFVRMLNYSWPLLLLGVAGILNQVADKICYTWISTGEKGEIELGLYGGAVKIAMLLSMLTQAFRYAYEPLVFSANRNDSNKKNFYADAMDYFVYFALFAFLGVIFYMDIIKYLVGSTYWEALNVIPIVMLAEIFMGIYFNLSFWYKLIDKTWWGAIFSFTGCAVLIAMLCILIPRYGYTGCAWAGFCGYGTCMLLSFFIGQKQNRIDYHIGKILGYFAVAIAFWYIATLMDSWNLWLKLSLRTAMLAVWIAPFAFKFLKSRRQ